MKAITSEIERALSAGLYYLALAMSLSLPDICAALESPDGETSGQRYKRWCDVWFLPCYPELTSLDLYSLRCGVLHQGRLGHSKMQFSRVLSTVPNSSRNISHRNIKEQ